MALRITSWRKYRGEYEGNNEWCKYRYKTEDKTYRRNPLNIWHRQLRLHLLESSWMVSCECSDFGFVYLFSGLRNSEIFTVGLITAQHKLGCYLTAWQYSRTKTCLCWVNLYCCYYLFSALINSKELVFSSLRSEYLLADLAFLVSSWVRQAVTAVV